MKSFPLFLSLLSISFVSISFGVPNGLALTPAMGWNSWASFACFVNETNIYSTIDLMVKLKLPEIGYNYVNLDDCWASSRNTEGTIQSDPITFPHGIKALADYAHSKGLKFGIYSSAGLTTCAGRPGSLGYERNDAITYASWGVDYLKYDNCPDNQAVPPKVRYPVMSKALSGVDRPILYSLCEWGVENPPVWAPSIANSWRTTDDLRDNWDAMMRTALFNNLAANYAKPGAWNDPDQLQIGNGGMSTDEYRVHFSLWSIMKAPLLISTDLTKITSDNLAILSNPEVIAVNQDKLGVQGKIIYQDITHQVWLSPLSDGSKAVVVVGVLYLPQDVSLPLQTLFGSNRFRIRDLWTHKDLGVFTDTFVATQIPRHGCRMFRIKSV